MEKIYYCENCGNVMDFDPRSQKLKCPSCDAEILIENDISKVVEHKLTRHAIHTVKAVEKTSHTMECTGCGAKIEVEATSTAAQCPYCGSNYVLSEKQEDTIIPDGVVPFQIDKNRVAELFREWMKKRWLAPGKLKYMYQSGKLQGIYLPYWTFDADVDSRYTAMGGRYRTITRENSKGEKEEVVVTDWFPTSGRIHHFFDDVLVPASDKLDRKLLKGMDAFETDKIASYAPEYFSGYSAECFTVDLEDAHQTACSEMKSILREMVRSEVLLRYDTVRDIRIYPEFDRESYKHVLLPVYTTAYHYRDRLYHVFINGQTGTIQGEYPKSAAKIAAIVLVFLLLVLLLYFWMYQ